MFYDDVVGLLSLVLRNVEAPPRYDSVLVVLGLLRPVVQLLAQRVDVVPVLDAVEGAAGVQVGHLGVASVDEVVEHVVDAQLQLVLLEEWQDLIDAQAVIFSVRSRVCL